MSLRVIARSGRALGNAGLKGFIAFGVAVTLSMMMAGCSVGSVTTATTNAKPRVAKIELGLYSGRPDPSWVLSVADSTKLDKLIAKLHRVPGQPVQGGLGYRGFKIFESNRTLIAFRGEVAALGAQRNHLVDDRRSIERFLLQSGRVHLSATQIVAVMRGWTTKR